MKKQKWSRHEAKVTPAEFVEKIVPTLMNVKNAPIDSPKEIRDADPVLMEEKENHIEIKGEIKRNKIFDFAGELSMKVCPDVKVMVLNHNVKSIIFTVTFDGLSQADIDGVIEASK